MRKLKFKAWDTVAKKMYDYVYRIYPGLDGIPYSVTVLDDERNKLDINDYFEVMQYTGLKDKNGREIYEGDIVNTPIMKKQPIEWFTSGFWLGNFGSLGTRLANLSEVIGNIYENPDLLK